jgi:DNA-binding transcriptional LysR family regulator
VFNLAQLRSFVVVAEELNFSKAAQKLYVTQPALSRQVRLLEDSLGTSLFVRANRTVHLTSAGALLLHGARDLLVRAGRLEESVRQKGGSSVSILIGVGMNLAESIHRVGIQHMKCYPKVSLIYREMLSGVQGEALHSREIDVGFLRPPANPAYVMSEFLFSQPMVAVLPKTHPLSSRKKVKLAELANEILFLPPRQSRTGKHEKVLALYRNAGIKPRVVETTLSPQFFGSMHGACGDGIYILSAKPPVLNSDLAAVILDEPGATREVHIAWRKGERSPHILSFVDTARNELGSKAALKARPFRPPI